MKHGLKLIATIVLTTITTWSFEVVAFIPDYGSGYTNNLEYYENISQMNYFTVTPNSNGSIDVPSSFGDNFNGPWIQYAKQNGIRSSITIGGAGHSSGFSSAVSPTYRTTFINNIVALVEEVGYTGVDIDWEFPGYSDSTNFINFLQQLKAALPAGSTLSVDVPATDWSGKYFPTNFWNYCDYVNIMSYDDYWSGDMDHSSYSKMLSHISYWTGRGVAKSKLVVGVPFYGRNGASTITYANILTASPSISPSTNVYNSHYFNGYDLIKQKTQYLKDQSFAGIMIWEITQDNLSHQYSLLKAINEIVTPQFHSDIVPESSSSVASSSSVIVSSSQVASSSSQIVSSSSQNVSSSATSGPCLKHSPSSVEANSEEPSTTFYKANAIDGSYLTRWSSDYDKDQWITVDLGSVKSVDRVVVSWDAAYAKDFMVRYSQTGMSGSFTTLDEVTSWSGGASTHDFTDVNARYIGIEMTEGVLFSGRFWGYSIQEIEVYEDCISSNGSDAINVLRQQYGVDVIQMDAQGISVSNPQNLELNIQITNSLGARLQTSQTTSGQVSWSSPLNQGVYFIKIQAQGQSSSVLQRMLVH